MNTETTTAPAAEPTPVPAPPLRFVDTETVAPDTFLIRQLYGEGVAPVALHVNTMVITGAEPVLVDTGPASARAGWLERTFEVVDPADVRWIYLSHDDPDHTGNLNQVLEMCPQATLVTNWFSMERMGIDEVMPAHRMRWLNDGESFMAGDRELVAVVPPVFDSPTTRGLFDRTTGVYWGADSFALPLPYEVSDIGELPPGFFREAFLEVHKILSPWHQWLDPVKFQRHLDRIAALQASAVASCHGVTLRGGQVGSGLELFKELPYLPAAQLPGQAQLEEMLHALTLAA